jgi:hypothetical protein
VGTVSVSAIGGSGGAGVPFEGSEGGTGGEGAVVTNGALPVGPGAILFVDVGGGGSPGTFSSNCNGVPNPGAAGGDFDGGGGGGGPNDCVLLSGGGGGGGSSAVSSEARADATLSGNPATDSRLLVAGAGAGGGGQSGNGGNAGDAAVTGAGNSGGSPACDPTPNGSSGGVGGPGGTAPTGCLRPGGSGSASAGGAGGGGGCASGGGGGGGWFGGAGASITCAGAGGGGGSSYAGAGSGTTSVTTADSTQAPEVAISWVAVVNNGAPSISGTPADGQILTADPGTWNSPDTVSYSYQWVSCADATTANCTSDIPNATNLTYTLQASDVGTFVGVVVTATDNESQSASATASPVGAVGDPPPPQNDTLPVISGSAVQDGVVVSKIPGTWSSPDTLTYGREWERCPTAAAGPGSGCVGIKPENSGLALTAADVGFYITIMVTATDQEQQSTTIYATPFGPVTAPAPPSNTEAPVISGTASVGSVLHVSTGTWSSPDHLAYTYQWGYLASPGGTFTALTGATRNHYRLGTTNLGEEITVQVTTTDKEGQSSTVPAAQPVGPVERRS